MRKKRKQYSAQEKVAILRKHLLDKIPVSELCDEYGLQPTSSIVGRSSCSSRQPRPVFSGRGTASRLG